MGNVEFEDEVEESEETSELIEKYRETCSKHIPQIEECMRIAEAAVRDAERIAEEHGIPFRGQVSRLRQTYTPANLPDLDRDTIGELAGAWAESYSTGWQNSQMC